MASASTTPTTSGNLPPDEIIGTPYQDIYEWDGRQSANDDCAIRAQQFIIEQFTGQKLSEQALEQEAAANGWYAPGHGGTPIADMGKLLQDHGIPVDTFSHATVTQLADELAQGHKVIVAINAEDLWRFDPALAGQVPTTGAQGASGSQSADHAVVVSGIDTTDPNHPKVLISDPGTGEALASYPLDDFLKAWKTSDFAMVATHDPAPSTLPEMANFDYQAGHIPMVMNMPYDEFHVLNEEFSALPAWWECSGAAMPWSPMDPASYAESQALQFMAEDYASLEHLQPASGATEPFPYGGWEHLPF
jgi:hypothetical protein